MGRLKEWTEKVTSFFIVDLLIYLWDSYVVEFFRDWKYNVKAILIGLGGIILIGFLVIGVMFLLAYIIMKLGGLTLLAIICALIALPVILFHAWQMGAEALRR